MCMLLPSQVCEYGMKTSASVPVSIRAGLLATWVQCKQLLQQPIPSKTYGIEEDVSVVMIYGFYQPGAGPIYLLPDKSLQTLRAVVLCQRRPLDHLRCKTSYNIQQTTITAFSPRDWLFGTQTPQIQKHCCFFMLQRSPGKHPVHSRVHQATSLPSISEEESV